MLFLQQTGIPSKGCRERRNTIIILLLYASKPSTSLYVALVFLVISAALGFLCHHCHSLHNTESRLHTAISTIVRQEAICQKIHLSGNYFSHSWQTRSLHSGKCFISRNPCTLRWKWVFFTSISKFASFSNSLWCQGWTGPQKRLEFKVNFLSTNGVAAVIKVKSFPASY